ncbi:MAG: BatD family protein [Bacteroidota bacterium]|nr:BatD family protein [Bacteroidota bacterium]
MKKIFLIILLISIYAGLWSQNVSFTASASRVVARGEQFRLTYKVNAEGQEFSVGTFTNFRRLSGPNPSSSSSIQMSGGQVSKQISNSYTYILVGQKAGKFTIPPATIKVDGKRYKSNSLVVEVVKRKSGNRQNSNNRKSNQTTGIKNDDVFVRVDLSKSTVWQGEHIIATLKVYSRTQNIKFTDAAFPSFDGFLTSEIKGTPKSLFRENYNGEVFFVGIFKKMVLFPQRSGEMIIEPFELQCQVSVQSGYRRDFFGRNVPNYKNLVVNEKSPARKITVKPLPGNKPASFTAAVGQFNMNVSMNKTEAKTNEAITMTVRISGTGNLRLIDPMNFKFPPDFEVYDPEIKNNYKASEKGITGTKVYKYLIIPRHAGDFTIPQVRFSYFDARSGKYKTLSSQEFKLHIEKGDDDQSTLVISGFNKEDVKFIGKDIRYINTETFNLRKKGELIFGSLMFWLTNLFAFLIFLMIVLIQRKRQKDNANISLMKNKRANKEAQKRLKQANAFMKENNESKFYQEVLSAMYGYLSDKLSIPFADLNKETAFEKLSVHNLEESDLKDFRDLLDTCEFAQYAPGAGSGQMEKLYGDAAKLIGKFEQKVR